MFFTDHEKLILFTIIRVGRLGFKKRKSLLEEKGKDLSSFLKTNGSNNRQKSADQFEENFSHPNELNF